MGILTPHWLQHLQASFKVTGTEAGHDRGEAAHPHSSKDKPTLSCCLLELRSSEGPGGQSWLGVRDGAVLLSGNVGEEGGEEEGEKGRAVLEQIQDPGRKNIKKIHSLHILVL